MSLVRLAAAGGLLLLPAIPFVDELAAARAAEDMARAANELVASLTPEQRGRAVFAFADAERLNWHFVPRERRGLPLKDMTAPQRALAKALLEAGLGARGYLKASTVMELELVLRELGGNPVMRDPELYFFSIFGTPSAAEPWGWRAEGHHLSLNFTIVRGTLVATAPAFLGANPARVPSGARAGLRALAAEEDLARELVRSLDADQRTSAILAGAAPRDIVTGNAAEVDPLSPTGISAGRLSAGQKEVLRRLIDEYLSRMADDLAAERRAKLSASDFDAVTFAWAGTTEPGGPHYYRVQGPTFLIEYDNTQNDANHIHSVWRDFEGDFGRDLLRAHYRATPHPQQ
jgi:hypothetical protein